jgi:hypothetical protein
LKESYLFSSEIVTGVLAGTHIHAKRKPRTKPIRNVIVEYGKTLSHPAPASYSLGKNFIASVKTSLKVKLKAPVAMRTMMRTTTSIKSLKPFLIIAPTSKPMMRGNTIGIIQAISGGIDIVIPKYQ